MLFLNSGARSHVVSGIIMRDQSYTNKMGQSLLICGCLLIVTGLILIVIGVSSTTSLTMYVGIGIIGTGVGFFLTALVCLYGKLDICYNNWAYRTRVLPTNLETSAAPPPLNTISRLSFAESASVLQKRISAAPVTMISDIEVPKIVIQPSIQIGINNLQHAP